MNNSKWKSRKFWISVAAFLGSVGASITGIATDNRTLAVAGAICMVVSQAIYAAAEAYTDAARAFSEQQNKEDVG